MNDANIAMLESAAEVLEELAGEVAFVGGTTVELWVTDEASPEFRPTKDVDVIVEITTRTAYYRLEERLRKLGFENHQEDGVVCRFRHPASALLLDVMPMEASILGFEGRWLRESFPRAVSRELPSGRAIKVVPPVYLMATKLEAFASRGDGGRTTVDSPSEASSVTSTSRARARSTANRSSNSRESRAARPIRAASSGSSAR